MSRRPSRAAAVPAPQLLPMQPLDHRLVAVAPGPDAILTPAAFMQIEEWIGGWFDAAGLCAAGIPTPGPLLLHGPPGTGKTSVSRMLARRFAGAREVVVLDAMRVTDSHLGMTASNVSEATGQAVKRGAVLVIEEVDVLATIRMYSTGAEVEGTRTTTAIMRVLELPCPIVMTSNRIDVLDPAVMRRCEYVVEMPEPTPEIRREIVARELGADPGVVEMSLTAALPLARRARRVAWLRGDRPADVFAALCSSAGGAR